MTTHRARLLVALIPVFVGCVPDDGSDPETADGTVEIDGTVRDVGPDSDGSEPDAAEPEPDPDAAPPDAAPDMAPGDAAPPPAEICDNGVDDDGDGAVDCIDRECHGVEACAVDDCETACGRVAACERLDIFGDYDACLDACARASRREPPQNWFTCLQFEENCRLLQVCRLPDPPPLTCDEVCVAADGCGLELPFPDCPAECEDRDGGDPEAPPFALCGEALVGDVCDGDGFWSCLGDSVYTACASRCEVSVACNLERAEGCLQACVGEASLEDPLARLRGRQSTQCINRVGDDCRRADECLNPQAGPVQVDRATLCAAWDPCGAQFGFPCDELWFIAQDQPGFAECVVAQLQNGCPDDPFFALEACLGNPNGQLGPGCAELCEARGVCGMLPDGQEQLECLQECSQAIQGRDGESAQRQRALFPCGIARTCDELSECLVDNSPVSACAAHCAALDGCGLADADCAERCDTLYFRARQGAFRTCVDDAGDDCDAMALCDPGLPMGCAERCERQALCRIAPLDCEALCDDESFADPLTAARRTACVLTAPLCTAGLSPVSTCAGSPDAAGQACLGYCRAQTGCDIEAVEPLVDCLVRCGEGFVGDEGLRFLEARGCLERANAAGACAPLEACIPEAPAVDCPAWCDPLAACDAAPADCGAACPEDPLSRLRAVTQVECLADAADCDVAMACYVDPEGEVPPPVDVVALCADYRACGLEDFFPCQLLIQEFAPDDATLRCVEQAISPCPPDPFLVIDLCLGGRPGDPEALAPCADLCEARGRCGELEDSIRDCTSSCVNTLQRDPNGALANTLECRDALSCPDLAECILNSGPARRCADVCDRAVGCGAFPEEAACIDRCSAALLDPRVPRTYLDDVGRCLDGVADDPVACAAEGAACFDLPPVPDVDCEGACNVLFQCGLADGDFEECIIGCQGAPQIEEQLECVFRFLADRCDIEGFSLCAEQIGPPPDPVDPEPQPEPQPER